MDRLESPFPVFSVEVAGVDGLIRIVGCVRRQSHLEDFLQNYAGAIERVIEPEIGREGMMGDGCDDAIFESVAGCEPKNADGFDAHILMGRGVGDGGIGSVGDGAGEESEVPPLGCVVRARRMSICWISRLKSKFRRANWRTRQVRR